MLSKPVDVGSLKIGQYIVLENEPCKIVGYEHSKPGKHGAAKARIVAIGVFTNQKRNVISPVDGRLDVPLIEKKTGQVISVTGEMVQLMDMETYVTFETPFPDEEELRGRLSSGQEVEYWQMLGRNKIVRIKS
ncbi:translation initiation factor IF-5A [Candidatus Bathyarchaeota archaeon]|nr:translation initiation factor IF-5A [Candidatus Bathyarchaeota archaeon]